MEGSSSQSGSSSNAIASEVLDNNNSENRTSLSENKVLLKLEENGFTTPDDKVEELLKNLAKPKCLYALKILFENTQNGFSSQVSIDSLVALANPTPFNYYSKESVARLELHLRTWVAVLERICFSPICLTRELREDIYNSLAKFAEIHRKTTQVIERGLENNFKSNLNISQQQKNDDENYIKKRNYNIDFLLIHIRDTLHSLRDDETWFEEILRRVKDILKAALGITSATGISINDNSSVLNMLSQLRQGLNFKYPVASYYVDWRIMLIIQNNINKWSLSSEKIISKKFGEMILMEYFWSYVEREWIGISDKAILDSQTKFDELSNKVIKALKNTESFLNDITGNEPLALPHNLWFGILDLAHNLIQKSTRTATHGLCYYLAIESLNKAPSSFIQFKATEILLHLHNINNELFSMVDLDFDQYVKKLNENNTSNDSSRKFQNLLSFVREKYLEDLEIINDDTRNEKGKERGKEKSSVQNASFKHDSNNSNNNILNHIADEITCPITYEPADQLCILECQHVVSSNNLKKLKQAKCPICKKQIVDDNIRYLPQNTIYKNLYSQFFEAGHILTSIEAEDQYNSNSDESDDDMILTKKRHLIKSIKFNSSISLQSIFRVRYSKKQDPVYQNVLKELEEGNYEKAVLGYKEFLEKFPKSYSIRCILAYTYRYLNKYDEALFYLKEAIDLKSKNPIAWYIRGEIFFRQNNYYEARDNLLTSIKYKIKINNVYIILGKIYLLLKEKSYDDALHNFEIALQTDPNNYLCLKHCAYIYEIQKNYSNVLNSLDKLLSINKEDSLILCYYGEILSNLEKYDEAILYFNKANDIDPENTHTLSKRAIITYNHLNKYKKALSDINKALSINKDDLLVSCCYGEILLNLEKYSEAMSYFTKASNIDPENIYILFKKSLAYSHLKKDEKGLLDINKVTQLDLPNDLSFSLFNINFFKPSNADLHLCKQYHNINNHDLIDLGIFDFLNMYMYKVKMVYYVANFMNDRCYEEKYSLIGKVVYLCSKNKIIELPKLSNIWENSNYSIVWKIYIGYLPPIPLDIYIKFTIKSEDLLTYDQQEHELRNSDIFNKFPKYEWVEYTLPFTINTLRLQGIYPSIEINGIGMFVDYVQFIPKKQDPTLIPNHRLPNVPEAFKERYFSEKEMENLLELKDIISN